MLITIVYAAGLATPGIVEHFFPPVTADPMGSVVVAATSMRPGDPFSHANVRLENWPSEIIPAGTITDPNTILDKISARPISKGMPVSTAHIKVAKIGDHNERLIQLVKQVRAQTDGIRARVIDKEISDALADVSAKLSAGSTLTESDLSMSDFSYFDFQGCNFTAANFKNAKFRNVNLSGVDLSSATIDDGTILPKR